MCGLKCALKGRKKKKLKIHYNGNQFTTKVASGHNVTGQTGYSGG